VRNIVREAGVEPVGPVNDVTYSGNGLLTIHALSVGSHYEASLCYWIPQDVYSAFEACIGIHPDSLNEKSGVNIQLINNSIKIS
jgi:hypothetical protein